MCLYCHQPIELAVLNIWNPGVGDSHNHNNYRWTTFWGGWQYSILINNKTFGFDGNVNRPMITLGRTIRERLKSALYLRLKKRKVFKPVKGGTLRVFRKSSLLQNIKEIEGGTLWRQKKSKFFLVFEKKRKMRILRGDPLGFLVL